MDVCLRLSLSSGERAATNMENLRPVYEIILLLGVTFGIEIRDRLLIILASVSGVFVLDSRFRSRVSQLKLFILFPTSVDILHKHFKISNSFSHTISLLIQDSFISTYDDQRSLVNSIK